ncbi:hypothetical protein, partial [Serratia marcescens]
LKTQPATGETYPKSDLFNKAEETLNSGGSSNGVSVPAPTDTGLPGGSTVRATIVWVRIGMLEFIPYSNRVGGFGTLTPAADFAAAEKL